MSTSPARTSRRSPERWRLRKRFSFRAGLLVALALVALSASAHHTKIDGMLGLLVEYAAHAVGLAKESQVARGIGRYMSNAWPPVLSEETPVARIEGFDPRRVPLFTHLATRTTVTSVYDFDAKAMVQKKDTEAVLVRPLGYLLFVMAKMLESLEMALWGTLLGTAVGAPLAYACARGYAPNRATYYASRTAAGFLRAMPELVSALFLVLAFGFGPVAGVLALGLHSAGFFAKFFADDVENADPGPQEALASLGASKFKVLWFAAIPQVLPQYIAYAQYVLERNVRMSTVIGVVGAGGIGIELKGRFDQFEFNHVTTILLVIVATVLALERVSQWARAKLI